MYGSADPSGQKASVDVNEIVMAVTKAILPITLSKVGAVANEVKSIKLSMTGKKGSMVKSSSNLSLMSVSEV